MRTFLKVQMDTEAASDAIAAGELPQVMQSLTERIKPEAAFFSAEGGLRTGYFLSISPTRATSRRSPSRCSGR